jgi:hypothetical protein
VVLYSNSLSNIDGTPKIEMTMIYTTPGVEELEAAM